MQALKLSHIFTMTTHQQVTGCRKQARTCQASLCEGTDEGGQVRVALSSLHHCQCSRLQELPFCRQSHDTQLKVCAKHQRAQCKYKGVLMQPGKSSLGPIPQGGSLWIM